MTEPESHTLRLLREIRTVMGASDGKIEAGSVTVLHNGVLVQDHVSVSGQSTTSAAFQDVVATGPLMLQDHGSAVRYRNIWVRRL